MAAVGGLRAWGLRMPTSPTSPSNPVLHTQYCLSITCRSKMFSTFSSLSSPVSSSKKDRVLVISGPTGAGKSRLALELAKRLNGEIISADSVQVYRGLDVGSAKPSLKDRKEVPHHLLDILHPSEEYSVGQFYVDARRATRDVLSRGRVPIVTGGTGLYLRWFIYGKPDVPIASREITTQVCAELEGYENIGDWDTAVKLVVDAGDPKAQSLPRNNWYRLRRSLEIIKSSGAPPSAFAIPYDAFRGKPNSGDTGSTEANVADDVLVGQTKELDYDFMCYFLSTQRFDLYRSIDFRCEEMVSGSDGILAEAKWLLDMGLLPNSNSATRAIGYRQAMEYLEKCRQHGGGRAVDFFTFLHEFQKASRNFAKRQLTWFRNELIYEWLDASNSLEQLLNFIIDAYFIESGNLAVPESLRMRKDISDRRETAQLKAYRPKNKYFVNRGDCAEILTWMRTEV